MNEFHLPPDLFFEMQQAAKPRRCGCFGFLPMLTVAVLQRLGKRRSLKAAAGLADMLAGYLAKLSAPNRWAA
jgi:hypothetical protein